MNEKGLSALDYCDMFRFADLGQYLVLQGAESGKCDAEGGHTGHAGRHLGLLMCGS